MSKSHTHTRTDLAEYSPPNPITDSRSKLCSLDMFSKSLKNPRTPCFYQEMREQSDLMKIFKLWHRILSREQALSVQNREHNPRKGPTLFGSKQVYLVNCCHLINNQKFLCSLEKNNWLMNMEWWQFTARGEVKQFFWRLHMQESRQPVTVAQIKKKRKFLNSCLVVEASYYCLFTSISYEY